MGRSNLVIASEDVDEITSIPTQRRGYTYFLKDGVSLEGALGDLFLGHDPVHHSSLTNRIFSFEYGQDRSVSQLTAQFNWLQVVPFLRTDEIPYEPNYSDFEELHFRSRQDYYQSVLELLEFYGCSLGNDETADAEAIRRTILKRVSIELGDIVQEYFYDRRIDDPSLWNNIYDRIREVVNSDNRIQLLNGATMEDHSSSDGLGEKINKLRELGMRNFGYENFWIMRRSHGILYTRAIEDGIVKYENSEIYSTQGLSEVEKLNRDNFKKELKELWLIVSWQEASTELDQIENNLRINENLGLTNNDRPAEDS